MRSSLPIIAVVFVLVLAFVAIHQNVVSDEQRAQALWAEAELMAFRAIEDESCHERAAELFTQAIQLASHKAPIYVAFGQSDSSSAWELEQLLDNTITSGVLEESPLSPNALRWLSRLDTEIQRSLRRGASRVLTGATLEVHLETLSQRVLNGSPLSLRCYQAAVADDPSYLAGWTALSMAADGELRERALQEWAKRDTNNALPLYMQAYDAWEKSRDIAAVLRLVAEGNQRDRFVRYERDWPSVDPPGTWPAPFAGEAGLEASTPVTTLGLKNFAWHQGKLWEWTDQLCRPVRHLPSELLGLGRDLVPPQLPPGYSRSDVVTLMEEMCNKSILSTPPYWMDVTFGLNSRRVVRGTSDELNRETRAKLGSWIDREQAERKRTFAAQMRGEFDYSTWVRNSLYEDVQQFAEELRHETRANHE